MYYEVLLDMVSKNDWRRMGQEEYLMGEKWKNINSYVPYSETWEHEHCIFCAAKISANDGDLHEGYCTLDEKQSHWVCRKCFNDFKDEFQWIVDIL